MNIFDIDDLDTNLDLNQLPKLDVRKELMGEDFKYDQHKHETYTKDWFESLTYEMNNIYFDLMLLKDLRLGTLLHISSQEPKQMQYIRECLPNYDRRIHDTNIFEYFPNYIHLKELYDKTIQDVTLHPYLWLISPHTYLLPFLSYMTDLSRKSAVMHQRVYTVNFFVNTYPYQIDVTFLELLKRQLSYIYRNYTFTLIFKPYNKLTKEFFDKMDVMFVDDLINFIRVDVPIVTPLFDTLEYEHKYINAPRRADISLPLIQKVLEGDTSLTDGRTLDQLFSETESYFQLVCYFNYFAPVILIEEDFEPVHYREQFLTNIYHTVKKLKG
jgi:hypothetical protein